MRTPLGETTSVEPAVFRRLALEALDVVAGLRADALVQTFWVCDSDRIEAALVERPSGGDYHDLCWSSRANNVYFVLRAVARYNDGRMKSLRGRRVKLSALELGGDWQQQLGGGAGPVPTVEAARELLVECRVVRVEVLLRRMAASDGRED